MCGIISLRLTRGWEESSVQHVLFYIIFLNCELPILVCSAVGKEQVLEILSAWGVRSKNATRTLIRLMKWSFNEQNCKARSDIEFTNGVFEMFCFHLCQSVLDESTVVFDCSLKLHTGLTMQSTEKHDLHYMETVCVEEWSFSSLYGQRENISSFTIFLLSL